MRTANSDLLFIIFAVNTFDGSDVPIAAVTFRINYD